MAIDRQQRGDWVKSSLSRHLAIGFGPIAFDSGESHLDFGGHIGRVLRLG
jgi:hypothetical protein